MLTVEKYQNSAPQLAEWLEASIPQGLTIFELPAAHRKKLRTSNLAERVNKEIKRRTKIVSIFPNNTACLRLVSAMLVELDEEWSQGNNYLNMSEF